MKLPSYWSGLRLSITLTGCGACALTTVLMQPSLAHEMSLSADELAASANSQLPFASIPRVSEQKPAFTRAKELLAQSGSAAVGDTQVLQVTGVRLNQTATGLEVILETEQGTAPQVTTSSYDQTLLIDISNARLNIPDGEEFYVDNPADDITSVTVSRLYTNSVRVTVIGEAAVPTVAVTQSANGLVVNLASDSTTAAQPTPTPEAPDSQLTDTLPEAELTEPTEPTTEEPELPELEDEEFEIVVTGEQDGYRVPDTTTATRTDTPIRDIPQSIQVIPRQVIEEQNALRLPEIFRNVSSVAEEGGFGDALDQFNIRGFSVTGQVFRDGFRVPNVFSPLVETANLESVEILKGPASVLYGNLEPGGIINLVTKRPLEEPYYAAELSVGSYGFFRPTIDFSGPLNSDRTVLYRLNAVYETGERWREYDTEIERFFIAPVITWKISDSLRDSSASRTDLTVDLEYLHDERPLDRGIPAIGRSPADIPRDRVFGEPDDFVRTESFSTGYRLEHRFSDDWTLRNAFRYLRTDSVNLRAELFSLDEETGDLERGIGFNDPLEESYVLQTDLTGKFATGSIEHTLLFGVDLTRQYQHFEVSFPSDPFVPSINIFNPIRIDFPRPSISELGIPGFDIRTNSAGIFLQDQIAFSDNLKLLLGGRFDIVDQASIDREIDSTTDQYDEAFSPRIGIVYQPIPPLSLYASFTQAFAPNSATRADGSLLEPTRGTQYEVGIKGEFFDGRLAATLAAYEITKTNIATTDPDNPDFSIPVGEQRSRGIELDVIGEILPGWNIIASYGYIDAEVTEDNVIPVGSRLRNVPEHTASLWTTYEIQNGNLQGLGFGVGLFYVGEKPGDSENSFFLPSYLRTDATLYYRRNNWKAAINVKNLFDVEYYESVNFGRVSIEPGAPLTVVGTFSIEF